MELPERATEEIEKFGHKLDPLDTETVDIASLKRFSIPLFRNLCLRSIADISQPRGDGPTGRR